MKHLIDKVFKVIKENGWYHEETVIVIIDHRLRRTFEVNEREANKYGKSEILSNFKHGKQTCYEYEFLVEVHCDETGKISHYTTYNDEVFLEYLANYCEEQRQK
jgi:hypothetical protein